MTPLTQSSAPPHNLQELTSPKEKSYHTVVVGVSILVWLAIAVTLVGIFYAALFALGMWFGNGLLIAYLRSEAVKVGSEQLPELHASFIEVCERLGIKNPPELYVLQAGGMLNAFATRFSGRDFVVVYSDLLEAMGPDSAEMKFILGHEIGHIRSRHILKQILLGPGLFMPLIGPAYRRSWETSCDRHGAYAAQDTAASVRAMLALAGGPAYAAKLSGVAFAAQHTQARGFFVSLHELTSTYPTLTRRVVDLQSLQEARPAPSPERHPLAYFFALGMPGGNLGNGGPVVGLLITVMVIGLLAAMAIPAFAKVRDTSQATVCINNGRQLAAALEQYRLENNKAASTWDDVIGVENGKYVKSMPVCPLSGEYEATLDSNNNYVVTCSADHPAIASKR